MTRRSKALKSASSLGSRRRTYAPTLLRPCAAALLLCALHLYTHAHLHLSISPPLDLQACTSMCLRARRRCVACQPHHVLGPQSTTASASTFKLHSPPAFRTPNSEPLARPTGDGLPRQPQVVVHADDRARAQRDANRRTLVRPEPTLTLTWYAVGGDLTLTLTLTLSLTLTLP